MRTLHLDAGREMRGGQWQVLRLIQGLEKQGVETTLLARAGGPLLEAARKAGCRTETLTWPRAFALARRVDLIHAHDSRTHTMAAIAGGAPLVVSRRVAFSRTGLRSVLSKWKYSRPKSYIAVSNFVREKLIERGVPAAEISVVYDGVPLLQASEAVGGCVLAPANAGDPRKGAALAIEAARLAEADLEFSYDLETDLARAALFAYITHSEGLGSGALLAMSAGVPVIASAVGGLREIIQDRENGLLVTNTPKAIAEAIRTLLDDAATARRIGEAGRRAVAERFSIGRMVEGTLQVYRQALA